MKILQIKLYNINSLRDKEHTIDFSKSPFLGTNLFAITGETGAGKTTILDAVTLAMYGRVARDCDVKEVISYGASEAYSEVEFQVPDGIYRAKWSIARARKKIDGNLQESRRELADISENTEGVLVAEKKKEIEKKIVELTKLDYDQFTKSVLLAQGDFAAFLKAGINERGKILERITGTDIYSTISKAAFEKAKSFRESIERLKEKLDFVRLLSEEDAETKKKTITERSEKIILLKQREQALKEEISWFKSYDGYVESITLAEKRLKHLAELTTEHQTEFERLEKHFKTIPFQKDHQDLKYKQREVEKVKVQLEELQKNELAISNNVTQQVKAFEQAIAKENQAQQELKERKEFLEEAIKIDEKVTEIDIFLQKEKKDFQQLKNGFNEAEKNLETTQKEVEERLLQDKKIDSWIEDRTHISALKEQFPLLKNQLETTAKNRQNIQQAEEEKEKLQSHIVGLQNSVVTKKEDAAGIAKQEEEIQKQISAIEESLKAFDKTEEELVEEKEKLEAKISVTEKGITLKKDWEGVSNQLKKLNAERTENATKKKNAESLSANLETQLKAKKETETELEARLKLENVFVSLEQERTKLKEGEPCPLCGSNHHPYVHGEALVINIDESQRKLEALRAELIELTQQMGGERNKILELGNREAVLEKERSDLNRDSSEINEQLKELLGENWEELNLTETHESLKDGRTTLNDKIKTIREVLQRKQAKKEEAQRIAYDKMNLNAELVKTTAQLENIEIQRTKLTQQITESRQELSESEQRIHTILEPLGLDENVTKDANEIISFIENEITTYQTAIARKDAVGKRIAELTTQRSTLEKEIEEKGNTIQKEKERLIAEYDKKLKFQERKKLIFPEQDASPKEVLEILNENLNKNTTLKNNAEVKLAELKTVLQATRKQLNTFAESEQFLVKEEEQQKAQLVERITSVGFNTWEDYLKAELPNEEAEQISERKNQLEKDIERAKQTLSDLNENKKLLEEKKPTHTTEENSSAKLNHVEQELEAFQNEKRSLEIQLEQDKENRRRLSEESKKLLSLQKEYEKWEELNGLIGSANGDKFRIFAQTLTLERLVQLANSYLAKIYERYLIEIKNDDRLGLQIVDTYQADHIRSMETLSGGESFLISLGLALGLSDMAGKNASIGTLFIDEGFGTLDPSILDLVITTLENLQSMGKTIGVISHVETLKERIQTQVLVKKQSRGVSTLEIIG